MNETDSANLFNYLVSFAQKEHEEKMRNLITEQEMKKFVMLKPKLFKDGDKWCVLLGDDLQSGIAGFGDSPYKAILDWDNAMVRE